MSETVNQENATVENEIPAEEKTFTQKELDSIVAERLKRERSKYEGFDELKAKAAKFDELEEASKTELQKATERAEKLQTELDSIKKSQELKNLRESVAKEAGIPLESMSLLTGETEEVLKDQAKTIMSMLNPSTYPQVPDSGEVHNVGTPSVRDLFGAWANTQLN